VKESMIKDLKVKIFADGANLADIVQLSADPLIKGFTTNPTLMRKAGIKDYAAFGRAVLAAVPHHPVSLEVFADDLDEMLAQARCIAAWGSNVNIKIPVTNTQGQSTVPILRQLSAEGISLNVTAVMTLDQVQQVAACIQGKAPAIISVFAGRIADTGVDPIPHMRRALEIIAGYQHIELLWASPREVLNIFQANDMGCSIITVTRDMLAKLAFAGKDLLEFSRETVQMFYSDALAAGYHIGTAVAV